MPNLRLFASFQLLLRALLGLGAAAAVVLGYSALLSLAVQAGQPLSGARDGQVAEGGFRSQADVDN